MDDLTRVYARQSGIYEGRLESVVAVLKHVARALDADEHAELICDLDVERESIERALREGDAEIRKTIHGRKSA